MFLGHYGVALAAKRADAPVSLGTAVLAAQLLDLIWPVLLLTGMERVEVVPGLMAASPMDFVHYPISHSLLAVAAWALLLGAAYFAVRRSVRGALVILGLVMSHWLLDAAMHRPDLPLWPGSEVLVGAGAWSSVPLTLFLEVGVLGLGLALYLRATRATDRVGSWGLGAGITLLLLFFLSGFVSAPPAAEALGWGGLALWLLVPWGYWVDRHRAPRDGDLPVTRPARAPALGASG